MHQSEASIRGINQRHKSEALIGGINQRHQSEISVGGINQRHHPEASIRGRFWDWHLVAAGEKIAENNLKSNYLNFRTNRNFIFLHEPVQEQSIFINSTFVTSLEPRAALCNHWSSDVVRSFGTRSMDIQSILLDEICFHWKMQQL